MSGRPPFGEPTGAGDTPAPGGVTAGDAVPEGAADGTAEVERVEFVSEFAGRAATCHGGGPVSLALGVGARATYVGRLSGRRLLYGDPPWTWLELEALIEQPEGSAEERIWCDEHNVFLHDAPGQRPADAPSDAAQGDTAPGDAAPGSDSH